MVNTAQASNRKHKEVELSHLLITSDILPYRFGAVRLQTKGLVNLMGKFQRDTRPLKFETAARLGAC